MGKRADAGRLAIEYEGDADGGVRLLVESHCWEEAVEQSGRFRHVALVDSLIVPAAVEAAHGLLADMDELEGKVAAYQRRYHSVRAKRVALEAKVRREQEEREAAAAAGGVEGGGGDDWDVETASQASGSQASTVGSGVSALSAYTAGTSARESSTTSKRSFGRAARRKAQKAERAAQGGRIRAGSPEEEQSLVEHIRNLGPSVQTLEEVRQLLEVLVGSGHETLARKLQGRVSGVISIHRAAVTEVDAIVAHDKLLKEGKEGKSIEGLGAHGRNDNEVGGGRCQKSNMDVAEVSHSWRWNVLDDP
eukprot:TRINITY_DN12501_c0_g1_i1.p1 TRINITY_DN12501_c0_g1~~TRINITY_DN12501_c0_g1_i1.p1  ORF type:complete len:321 (-),score=15.48 TRINITY_DN12501_c0_g1_i1:66-983(-)